MPSIRSTSDSIVSEIRSHSPTLSSHSTKANPQTITGPISSADALNTAYIFPFELVVDALSSDVENGLTGAEVQKRIQEYGPNQLEGGDEVSITNIIVRQVANAMTLVGLVFYSLWWAPN